MDWSLLQGNEHVLQEMTEPVLEVPNQLPVGQSDVKLRKPPMS